MEQLNAYCHPMPPAPNGLDVLVVLHRVLPHTCRPAAEAVFMAAGAPGPALTLEVRVGAELQNRKVVLPLAA
jgi:hypothetical protein